MRSGFNFYRLHLVIDYSSINHFAKENYMKDLFIWGFLISGTAFFMGIMFWGFYIVLFPKKNSGEDHEQAKEHNY